MPGSAETLKLSPSPVGENAEMNSVSTQSWDSLVLWSTEISWMWRVWWYEFSPDSLYQPSVSKTDTLVFKSPAPEWGCLQTLRALLPDALFPRAQAARRLGVCLGPVSPLTTAFSPVGCFCWDWFFFSPVTEISDYKKKMGWGIRWK